MRYPDLKVDIVSSHPLALIGAVRHALRRGGADEAEVARFSGQAMAYASAEDEGDARLRDLCESWVRLGDPAEPESRV